MLKSVLINVDLPRPDSPELVQQKEREKGGSVRCRERRGREGKGERTDYHGGEMETYLMKEG